MKYWLFLNLLLTCFLAKAQNNFEITTEKKTVLPFQLINNLIFIPININGVDLTFMLDTGVSETIIFSLENKELNLKNTEKIKFSGLGGDISVEGLKAENNTAKIEENFINNSLTLYIILDQDFNISSHIGIPVNGIIGYHFFKNHPIQIDYTNKKITIYRSENEIQKKIKKYTAIPISIEGNKPYLFADVELKNEKVSQKLLVDVGNSDPIWLFPVLIKDFVYNRPNIEDFLGRGFNGDIYGKRSRIHRFYLRNFKFEKPLIAMPDEFSIQHVNLVKDRKGSVGADILRRFTVVFDYPNGKMYLKKNRNYDDPFAFNMSGLDFKQDGMQWTEERINLFKNDNSAINKKDVTAEANLPYKFVLKPIFAIAGVRPDSPAALAGLKANDLLISINGIRASDFTMQKIHDLMKSHEGKNITLVIERAGKELKFSFILEDPIPYQD